MPMNTIVFVISSVFLSVAPALAGREMLCPIENHASHPIENMPRIHVKMICPMEKHASNSCDYDLSQLKNMPPSHVKTYRLELQI